MHIVITGGSGYLAGRIIENILHSSDHEISVISQKKSSFFINPRVKHSSWNESDKINNTFSSADVILHTAGFNASASSKNPDKAIDFARKSTKRIIKAMKSSANSNLIFFSTAHIYRSPLIGEINEDTIPENNHPYALSNLVGESLVENFNMSTNNKGLILRIGNCFGLPANESSNCWDLVINGMCKSAIVNKKINVLGPSNQVRNFVPMKTFLQKLQLVIENESIGKSSHILNIAYMKSFALSEIAELIQTRCSELFNFMPKINYEKPKDDLLNLNYQSKYIQTLNKEDDHFLEEIDEMLTSLYENCHD